MLTVKTLLKATQGRLEQGSESVNINGVSIDSRSMKKGNVFIAIKGARFDGHRFIRQVKGASVIIVSKKVASITIVGFLGIYVGVSLSELTLEGKWE